MRGISAVRRGAGVAVLVAALAGCSSVSSVLETSSPAPADSAAVPAGTEAPARKDSLTNMILGAPKPGPGPADDPFKPDDLICPDVTVRAGAGTLLLGSKGSVGEVTAMDLRYQGTLVKFARECKTAAGLLPMKIGIEGRVIPGPAGGPGQVDVPVRLAVVQEGPSPKTVLSKLVRIPVTVTAENPTVDFTHVDSDVAFPMPRPVTALESYIVYVGFDASAMTQRPAPSRRKR